jgi:lipopolysaccharide/colanic/teichoic acid biosynthesis glycosyltransferase
MDRLGEPQRRRAEGPRGYYQKFGKRLLDVTLGGLALLMFAPVIGATALAVWISMGRPILFRQARPGLGERIFTMLKFRTMIETFDDRGELLPDAARVTRLGRLLRATSLDELPELWHVLKGDMSLVGPRPQLVEYLPYYSPAEHRRHSVRPGITGFAQISGRNETTWRRRLRQDVLYVNRCSLRLDCWIILRTLTAVLRGDGGSGAIEKLGRFRGTAQS